MRLKELEKKGFIERAKEKRLPIIAQWRLTAKGKYTLPILMQLVALVLNAIPMSYLKTRCLGN